MELGVCGVVEEQESLDCLSPKADKGRESEEGRVQSREGLSGEGTCLNVTQKKLDA